MISGEQKCGGAVKREPGFRDIFLSSSGGLSLCVIATLENRYTVAAHFIEAVHIVATRWRCEVIMKASLCEILCGSRNNWKIILSEANVKGHL